MSHRSEAQCIDRLIYLDDAPVAEHLIRLRHRRAPIPPPSFSPVPIPPCVYQRPEPEPSIATLRFGNYEVVFPYQALKLLGPLLGELSEGFPRDPAFT
mmetsp:Transcript_11723/g.19957  ORF Transcript_11723/g.19957 Transcript_11723/m.19957 type:complete len:98 (+) Transcript_11723:1034-1327(+)